MEIAFFDFDGTVTREDSLIEFIKYSVGEIEYYKGLIILSPILFLYLLKIVSNQFAKEKLIKHFFGGWDFSTFKRVADEYSLSEIDSIVRQSAIEKIKWHQKRGDKVVIVSASIECWLEKWCQKHNIELIATKLEVINGKLTGNFLTKNCYGKEKVRRIKERYNLYEYQDIYVYGDSKGDREMLLLADKYSRFYKEFDE
jgi:HAD superfamily hydrolase (TIGR01490 family)